MHRSFLASPVAAPDSPKGLPVIRGVFFSPTCGHCELVINEHLPGIFAEYGGDPGVSCDETVPPEEAAFFEMGNGTLTLLFVNVGVPAGAELFVADSERLGLERPGVPRLDIGDTYLVGSADVPAQPPDLIEQGIADGGMDWPPVPGIEGVLATIPAPGTADEPIVVQEIEANQVPEINNVDLLLAEPDSVRDRFGRDPFGNGLAVVVLIGLLISLVAVPVLESRGSLWRSPVWVVPVLAVVGIAVSIYLGSVEVSGAEAVCGPVGDCNAVQESEYSSILGVPIGILARV